MFARSHNLWSTVLILLLPLGFFTVLYLAPLLSIASYSVDNSVIASKMPATARWVSSGAVVDDNAAASLLSDLARMSATERAEVARLLNQEESGFRSLIMATGRVLQTTAPTMEALTEVDQRWAEPRFWQALSKNVAPITWRHFQMALGFVAGDDGKLVFSAEQAVYLQVLWRTLFISFQISVMTLLVGYPIAYAIANGSRRIKVVFTAAVLLSFWTSILVRTTAWMVLLQSEGLINRLLIAIGITDQPFQLIFNRFGTVVATMHILLPFAILPIVNVMRQIPDQQREASRSLGAGPVETFLRIYFPQTMRGVIVGGGTVFTLALGFYITPALVGGAGDQLISYYIADFVQKQLNWGMASALSILLIGCVLAAAAIGAFAQQLYKLRRS